MLRVVGCVLCLGFDLTGLAPASEMVFNFALCLFFSLYWSETYQAKNRSGRLHYLTSSLHGGVPPNYRVNRTQAVSGDLHWKC